MSLFEYDYDNDYDNDEIFENPGSIKYGLKLGGGLRLSQP
jgi:hypothetical protein